MIHLKRIAVQQYFKDNSLVGVFFFTIHNLPIQSIITLNYNIKFESDKRRLTFVLSLPQKCASTVLYEL